MWPGCMFASEHAFALPPARQARARLAGSDSPASLSVLIAARMASMSHGGDRRSDRAEATKLLNVGGWAAEAIATLGGPGRQGRGTHPVG